MNIKTKEFKIEPIELFRINLRNKIILKACLLCIIACSLAYLKMDVLIWTLIFVGILLLRPWITANNKLNKAFYIPKKLEFTENEIISISNSGAYGKFPRTDIIKTIKRKRYYLLYVSTMQYVYVPFDCFESTNDQLEWEKEYIKKAQ